MNGYCCIASLALLTMLDNQNDGSKGWEMRGRKHHKGFKGDVGGARKDSITS